MLISLSLVAKLLRYLLLQIEVKERWGINFYLKWEVLLSVLHMAPETDKIIVQIVDANNSLWILFLWRSNSFFRSPLNMLTGLYLNKNWSCSCLSHKWVISSQ